MHLKTMKSGNPASFSRNFCVICAHATSISKGELIRLAFFRSMYYLT